VTQEHREDDEEGFQRTRRLFSTLNQYAKPVSKRDIIALDEDDVVAIITRRFVDEHPLFVGKKMSSRLTKALQPNDRTSFTTIITLYDVLDLVLRNGYTPRAWKEFKRFRPGEPTLASFIAAGEHYWQLLMDAFPELSAYAAAEPADNLASAHRGDQGGHLLFRPIGLMLVTKAIVAMRSQLGLEEAARRCSLVPMQFSQYPWVRLLWIQNPPRVVYAAENQKIAFNILYHTIGGNLASLHTTEATLVSQWAEILGQDPGSLLLPGVVV
jgi:DNA sulfur modification protein DndB